MRDMRAIIDSTDISDRYDLKSSELVSLMQDAAKGGQPALARAITNAFKYGYALGSRATKNREARA